MDNVLMSKSDAAEVLHLFEVMEKYKCKCSLEMNTGSSDVPFIAIGSAPVGAEYFENTEGADALIVSLGNVDFSFNLGKSSFAKHVTSGQIMIAIVNKIDCVTAWFNGTAVPAEGIEEANNSPRENWSDAVNELNCILFEKYCLNYEESIQVARELLEALEDEFEVVNGQ